MRSIEEVVDEIERHAEYRNCDPTYLFENYDIENALDEILEIHKAEQQKKWIPVSERLPEEGHKIYLTCFQDGYMATIMLASDGKWLIEEEEPIAWMPLPKPFEPQERSDKE